MANGKGSLDCGCCTHFIKSRENLVAILGQGSCSFHELQLPPAKQEHNNRICCNFEPNENYRRDNPLPQFMPLARRFAWFGIDMLPGTLYEFPYNEPKEITKSRVLRFPDYHQGTWKKVDEE